MIKSLRVLFPAACCGVFYLWKSFAEHAVGFVEQFDIGIGVKSQVKLPP